MKTENKIICAWCKKHIGGNPAAEPVSHGICPDCAKTLLANIKTAYLETIVKPFLEKFDLETIIYPVLGKNETKKPTTPKPQ